MIKSHKRRKARRRREKPADEQQHMDATAAADNSTFQRVETYPPTQLSFVDDAPDEVRESFYNAISILIELLTKRLWSNMINSPLLVHRYDG